MKVVAIAPATLLWIAAILAAFWFVERTADLMVLAFLAIVVAAAVRPAIIWAEQRLPWIPRRITPAIVFILVASAIVIAMLLLAPVIAAQAATFAASLPRIENRFQQWWSVLTAWLGGLGIRLHAGQLGVFAAHEATAWLGSTAAIAAATATGISTLIFIFLGAFFILIDEPQLATGIVRLAPPAFRPWVEAQFEPIAARLGGYVRGLLINIVSLGTMLVVGYSLARVPFALVLGILSGLLVVIPFAEIAGLAIAILVALASDPSFWSLARVLIPFGIAETLQQNLVGPMVMSRAIALPPVILIFALLVGARLLGVEGMIAAVPVAATIAVLVDNIWRPVIEGSGGPPGSTPPPASV